MPKGHSPTPQARVYRINGTKKDGLRRAQQMAKSRGFVYDGHLAPKCMRCGLPREEHMVRVLKCESCERAAA